MPELLFEQGLCSKGEPTVNGRFDTSATVREKGAIRAP